MSVLSFDYSIEAKRITDALRKHFPYDTIATDEGYKGRVQVKVVSALFSGKTEAQKQEIIWGILKDELNPEDIQAVSLAIVYGTDEL